MRQCFIMQPFDNGGPFDKRYKEIVQPAVIECGYEPYRVDGDPSAVVLIDAIEKNIERSDVCIAEITINNPNVWYELGYAVAKGKKVILLCSDERTDAFPFDVRHRNILTYKTKSPSDFKKLKRELKARLGVVEELSQVEKELLKYIDQLQNTRDEVVAQDRIKAGRDEIDGALKNLVRAGYIEFVYTVENGKYKGYYRLTS